MAYLRLTLLQPRPGSESEVLHLLEELDSNLAGASGLLFSVVMGEEAKRLGRVSLWRSKEDANREAVSDRTLSLRSRLRFLSLETTEEMLDVQSARVSEAVSSLA